MNISTIDTYIITPAENPRAIDKNFVLVCLVKKASILPIPVDRPAKRVRPKAKISVDSSIDDCFFTFSD